MSSSKVNQILRKGNIWREGFKNNATPPALGFLSKYFRLAANSIAETSHHVIDFLGGDAEFEELFCYAFLLCYFADFRIEFTVAAVTLGLEKNKGKSRLNSYFHDSRDKRRPNPNAEILYLACTKLGFSFDYNGYRISATTFDGALANWQSLKGGNWS